jgi:hypothetical protein
MFRGTFSGFCARLRYVAQPVGSVANERDSAVFMGLAGT